MKKASLLLALCLILGMLSGLAVSASATEPEVWDGSVASSLSGFGTSSNPYVITNGAQLAYVAKAVNDGIGSYRTAHYRLGADIVLNEGDAASWAETAPANVWTPIGIATDGANDNEWRAGAFNGVFDGNGKTVSGVYVVNDTDSKNAGTGLFAIAKTMRFGLRKRWIS